MLPEECQIIIATVREVMGHGSYVTLDEYNNMTGFVRISEIATGWIRNIERYVRPKQKVVLKALRINKARGEVHTSLKQVSSEERRLMIIEAKKNDKSAAFLDFIKSKLKLIEEKTEGVEDQLPQNYSFAYDSFEAIARNGLDAINSVSLSQQAKDAIPEASKRIPVPQGNKRNYGDNFKKTSGIDIIKNTLANAKGNKGGAVSTITYVGAPRCRILVTAENFKMAEKLFNNTVDTTTCNIEKQQGTFTFMHLDSRKSHKLQLSMDVK